MAPKRVWPSSKGMAYARGAAYLRGAAALRAQHDDLPLLVLELVVRLGCVRMQAAVREVCRVRACSRQLREICSEDALWEQLYEVKWPLAAGKEAMKGWRHAFLARLARAQAHFLANTLPKLVRKRRRDGCVELRRIFESLKMSFTLRCSQNEVKCSLELSEASIQLFDAALAVRCTFSTALRCPLQLELLGRSASVGCLESLLTSRLQNLEDWPLVAESGLDFRRSPCGRVFLAFWKDGSLAGLFLSLHYAQILRPLLAKSEAWSLLAAPPRPDDLDSELGLHDYTMLLTVRSAKLECFSNCFYKIHAFKRWMFGGAGCSGKLSDSSEHRGESGRKVLRPVLRCPTSGLNVRWISTKQGNGRAGAPRTRRPTTQRLYS